MTGPYELTCREAKIGGDISDHIVAKFGDPVGERDLVLWIHGFNNPEHRIRETWERTHQQLRTHRGENLLPPTAWFFWPGETNRFQFIAAPFYFMEVADAISAGRSLARYFRRIQDANPDLRVHVVAHSLGSRVALELARDIRLNGGPPMGNMLLMAAATPEGLCVKDGLYPHHALREEVLHSRKDRVLRRYFRTGQLLARSRGDQHPGRGSSAVGYTGGPLARWDLPSPSCDLDHGDYWEDRRALARISSVYTAPKKRPDIADRELATRAVPARTISGRRHQTRTP